MLYAILAYHVETEVTSWSAEEDAELMVNLRKAHERLNAVGRLGPAARLDVTGTAKTLRGGTVVTFTVTRTAWYPKSAFPTDAVYGPTPDRQLRLITCGGDFNHALRSYRDNLVVYAVAG